MTTEKSPRSKNSRASLVVAIVLVLVGAAVIAYWYINSKHNTLANIESNPTFKVDIGSIRLGDTVSARYVVDKNTS